MLKKWNKNEFTVMKRRLNRFIPPIRFYNISSEDFLLKVRPFEEILDKIFKILIYNLIENHDMIQL
jgi:hypothetical protein